MYHHHRTTFVDNDDQSDQATGRERPSFRLVPPAHTVLSAMPWRRLAGKNDATAVYFFAP